MTINTITLATTLPLRWGAAWSAFLGGARWAAPVVEELHHAMEAGNIPVSISQANEWAARAQEWLNTEEEVQQGYGQLWGHACPGAVEGVLYFGTGRTGVGLAKAEDGYYVVTLYCDERDVNRRFAEVGGAGWSARARLHGIVRGARSRGVTFPWEHVDSRIP